MMYLVSPLVLFISLSLFSSSKHQVLSQTSTTNEPHLSEALASATATGFAKAVINGVSRGKTTGYVKTVYAPKDDSFHDSTQQGKALALLLSRQDAINDRFLYQISPGLKFASMLRSGTGSIAETLDVQDANLGGWAQSVVSHGQRDVNHTNTCPDTTTPIQMYSGMGDSVTIVKEDIPFDGGIIHITSGLFTIPKLISQTLQATSDTTAFANSLSTTLDATPSLTVFAPNNAALASIQNRTLTAAELATIVDAQVVEGFVAYSPVLVDGAKFKAKGGGSVTISVTGDGTIFVNGDSKVVRTDLVVTNGVVHIIDKDVEGKGWAGKEHVFLFYFPFPLRTSFANPQPPENQLLVVPQTAVVTPTAPPLATFTGGVGWSVIGQTGWIGGIAWGVFLMFAVSLAASAI
ncbi:MAG: hypothetical protein M1813_003165 [Trichoglossum hirsutum]|nr:MAG: hypothetical protein M1813_003165 [Trichoglossum hirsutum]